MLALLREQRACLRVIGQGGMAGFLGEASLGLRARDEPMRCVVSWEKRNPRAPPRRPLLVGACAQCRRLRRRSPEGAIKALKEDFCFRLVCGYDTWNVVEGGAPR
jgi:hypothetical protein